MNKTRLEMIVRLSLLIALYLINVNAITHLKSLTSTFNSPVKTWKSKRIINILCSIKGGKKTDDESADDKVIEDSNNDELDVELDDEDDAELDIQLGGGGGRDNPMLSSIADLWKKTPPMTKVYTASSIFLTVASFFLNKNQWPEFLHLEWKAVLQKFQFWRPFTAFLYFGPLGLNYILTIQFVWTYMAQLEKLNYKAPADYFIQMIFGAFTLLLSYTLLGISPKFLGHNLSTFLVYIWARVFEGSEVNVMDLFNLKAEILPWFFCLQTLVLEGEVPFADLLGIAVGHIYHYLSKKKLLHAPSFIQKLFASPYLIREYAKFKDDFE